MDRMVACDSYRDGGSIRCRYQRGPAKVDDIVLVELEKDERRCSEELQIGLGSSAYM